MSKLFVEPRKGGFGEAWYAVKFSFKNIKTWLPNQFWPAIMMVICLGLVLNMGGQFFSGIIDMAQQHQAMTTGSGMPTDTMQQPPMSSDMSAPTMSEDAMAAKMMGLMGLGSFLLLILVIPCFIVAALMSTVLFNRYMVLGEGQESATIPKFCLGKRELRVLGWSFLVSVAVSLPIALVLPLVLALVATSVGIDWTGIGPAVTPVTQLVGSIIALRFSFLSISASCDHPTTFFTSWRQMKGIFGSFLWANVAIVLIGIMPLLILMALVVIPAMFASKFISGIVLAVIYIAAAIIGTILSMVMTAVYSALTARYYNFGVFKS